MLAHDIAMRYHTAGWAGEIPVPREVIMAATHNALSLSCLHRFQSDA